ncbi:MAG: hypothetical protein QOK19_1278 [Solirubrobacteraceae bacterium]|jgi:uncharacterized protein (DUF1501 family)|nr:hypothetical protein [Solirubrobacterales bacterium]MEA2215717.1 hypothetical protein [Solirubrobacteraceae bacterium]
MARSCSCEDFNRSQLLRAGIARAGRGLPSIEPGMPIPAGTGMDRRSFLLRSAGAVLSVYGAAALSPRAFEAGIAEAAAAAPPDQPVLVSIFMEGGWDALSVLAPVKEARYHELRPSLGLAEGAGVPFSEDETLMWHPKAGGLAQLHGEGKVTVFPAIGYDPPDESHFTSRHYWEVGQLDTQTRSGWMGRYLDVAGDPGNPLQGLSLDYSLAPALATAKNPVAAVSSPSDYSFWAYGLDEPIASSALDTFGALGALGAPSPAFAQARAASHATGIIRNQIAPFGEHEGKPGFTSPVAYPASGGEFPRRLAVLAAMLGDEALPIKCVSLSAVGGYDTHSDEANTLATNLGQTVESVVAFQRDLEARKLDDRVIIQLWSEFGRRPQENGSGTDHGAAGVSLLIGSRLKGEMVGEFPGVGKLDVNDNLLNTSDFRAMYAGILGQWFATEAGLVIPGAGTGLAGPSAYGTVPALFS